MVDEAYASVLQVRGGGVMGKWLPKFVRVQAGVLEVYPDSEGHGTPGTTARLEDIADVTIDEVKGECCISLHSGGRIRARADEPEALNLFADALQPVHEPASARRPKVVVRPSKEAEASGVAASNERILQPQVDAQDPGSPPSNVPVHERLYAHSTVQQQRLEQKRQQKVMEEDQAIQERMAEWNAIKQKKEERRAKDPSFNEDPRDFHERAQAFEIAKQLKVRQRREEMLMEEQMRLEEEREMSMPTRQVGANYDPYEAADRLYRNALNKGKPKEGGGESDFWEATRKRKTEEELQAEKKAQAEREAEEKRKEKERQKRDKLVEDGKKRKLRKQEEAEKQKAKAGETTEDQEKSQKAKENRRKSTACVQRLAKPKSPKKGSPGDPSSTSQDAKSSSPKGSEAKAKSPKSPRAARSASPSKEGRSQRLAELAEAGSPKCGRKSVLAKRAEKMQTLQDRLVEEDNAKLHASREKDSEMRGKHARRAEKLWGIGRSRISSQTNEAEESDEVLASNDPDQARQPVAVPPLGARSPRFVPPARDKESHLLERLCEKIEARTGDDPMESLDEGGPERQALEHSLKRARALYAAAEAESRSDGYDDLCRVPNHRLVKGLLLPEGQEGSRARSGPPDPIFQQMENLDGLIEAGDAAQAVLMQELAQDEWEVGETFQLPVNVPTALFAYNPGPMSRDEADIKAMVLYGPMDGALCHRNLLDIARLTLVFPTCTVLKLGLEAVRNQFEVVKVHNYFRDPGPLGGRYIDVLVLIDLSQDPGVPYPYVCRIRLETLPYFQAAAEVEDVLEGLYDTLCGNDVSKAVAQSFLEFPEKKLARDCRRKFEAHYGSTLSAWRSTFGRKRLASFDAFRSALEKLRDPCARSQAGDNLVETWNQFDASLAGRITYFDFDPDSASLLTKLRSRFLVLYAYGDTLDEYTIYEQMTCLITPKKQMEWDVNEFRAVMRPFCMTTAEIDKVMQLLDQHGGKQPPITIRIQDIMFLLRLPEMFDVDTALINSMNMVSKAPPPRDGFGYAGEDSRIHVAGSPHSERGPSPKPKLKSGLTKHLALPAMGYDEEF